MSMTSPATESKSCTRRQSARKRQYGTRTGANREHCFGVAMKFLNGRDATAEIKKHVGESKVVRMAVAFWGEDAAKDLGLLKKGEAAAVICNLKMGN